MVKSHCKTTFFVRSASVRPQLAGSTAFHSRECVNDTISRLAAHPAASWAQAGSLPCRRPICPAVASISRSACARACAVVVDRHNRLRGRHRPVSRRGWKTGSRYGLRCEFWRLGYLDSARVLLAEGERLETVLVMRHHDSSCDGQLHSTHGWRARRTGQVPRTASASSQRRSACRPCHPLPSTPRRYRWSSVGHIIEGQHHGARQSGSGTRRLRTPQYRRTAWSNASRRSGRRLAVEQLAGGGIRLPAIYVEGWRGDQDEGGGDRASRPIQSD